MCLIQFHWHCWEKSMIWTNGQRNQRWRAFCHVAERQYRALIKSLRSQILSRMRCCFNYHDLNQMRKVERATPGTQWHLSGVENWICTTAAGFICCSKSIEWRIRVGVEHVFEVSTSPSLLTGWGRGWGLYSHGWCDGGFFFVCYRLGRMYNVV